MYTIDKESMKTIINGLSDSVKLIANNLLNSQNQAIVLKQLLPELIKINKIYEDLNSQIDSQEKS